MAEKKTLWHELTKGFVSENPVLRLVLGTCPTLAISTSVTGSLGMGLSATLVLIGSNFVVSLLRKLIPDKVRIPAYVIIIASFVSIVQMLVKAFAPAIDQQLGIFLPLIVVNCIILGRAEAFAGKNSVLASTIDGIGMGIGFTGAIVLIALIREFFGAGSVAGLQILPESIPPMIIFILPPGGFFVYGILMALANRLAERKDLPPAELQSCEHCPMSVACGGRFVDQADNEKEVKEA
ncbi:MAG: electron transport complex subunit E [Clostridiales bacterium]|nr:electron transport complex subunit E [Clostridiales bacterium]